MGNSCGSFFITIVTPVGADPFEITSAGFLNLRHTDAKATYGEHTVVIEAAPRYGGTLARKTFKITIKARPCEHE